MGLFNKKHHDNPDQGQQHSDQPLSTLPQQDVSDSFDSGINQASATLPQADHTLQNTNIDGILPATAETEHQHQQNNYTGSDDSTTAPPVPDDDQNQFIMDPIPSGSADSSNSQNSNHTPPPFPVDEPASYQDDSVLGSSDDQTNDSPQEEAAQDEAPTDNTVDDEQQIQQTEPDTVEQVEEKIEKTPPPPRHTDDKDLDQLKAEALKQLTPLAEHLDQSPEEKFHTTMMMLQATDDQNLVKVAFDAANSITDEKTRAQALLDIINEINYFTQNK